MKLAIDAMGGDYAPEEIIKGSLKALDHFKDIEIFLIGKEEALKGLEGKSERLKLIYASEVIENNEAPVAAIKKKKNSSMVVGLELLKKGEVEAFLSAGNTGALMAGSLLILGRIKGIKRPALAPILPTLNGATVLLDAGSNTDCDEENLFQFAVMGHVYAQKMFGIEKPRIGLFNVGTEEEKGNEVVKKAFERLKNSRLNFIGNVEGRDIPYGVCEVVVCDGFVGNAILKSMEGIAFVISQLLKEELSRNIFTKMGALLIMGGLKRITQKMDYTEYGGAPLLGISKPVIKAHGNSKAKAIFNAIKQAKNLVGNDVLRHIKEEIELTGDEISV
ncbi:glycerol-3-phosphate acyltransferase PlsX [Caldanaerobacter subterraneus subsp. tengcongensis MB4]|uniref:Phosphate acyltransferase n=1 Tax=Caldanaerobacter subterraneus subsp. tengcongensis (strain DSM 15242 / JCM 11007 / NBRC 100824 / MB4) TaxID=273068 RepID=PLSX_CALS4|nr:phosphate acyltransferase PlsX [Caldanaerobacter subterraneus]Q8R9V6.2 RecName: Full=Phosphate acyltransferase; AltName: Full=Acyl-ACP phosphotransacylase; AltName: Full=Acyl-[acyl-carrier-protein]--phosphate acyltransferase; AltName: Full=Phosphate-acyl-ACP acyltransferase [Caldanaerobacter subterraneus subsp. tengcongensis MB4]MCS3915740.1 glycerol-3-phosphate acyltransferase PlsX [Caldanaerobacter subterraneus subsp. tengcongensis MB4]